MITNDSRNNYRPEIDGLRALAVVVVIINHFDHGLMPSGYLGVDIFFVISGYVITRSLISRERKSLADFLLGFYARRFKRLAPALIAFVVAMSLATILFDAMPRESVNTGISALFGASNLYLLGISTDYFARSTELNSFTHTWSLGVEEQFYAVYPFLMWFLEKRAGRPLSWVILGLSAASLVGFVALYRTDQPAAYFLMPTRFWELGAGALVCLLQQGPLLPGFRAKPPTDLAAALIAIVLFAPLNMAVAATCAMVVLTAALIAGLRPGAFAHNLLSRREVVYVGRISYSLYLWHWGVLAVSRWTVGIQWWTAPLQLALIFALAAASYHWIESPLRQAEWSSRRLLTVGYALSASLAAYGLILFMAGPLAQMLKLSEAPAYLRHTWWIDRDTGEYLEKCHLEYGFSVDYIEKCLGDTAAEGRRVYLIGDSHARNYLPAVRATFATDEIRYLTMGYVCGFLPPEFSMRAESVRCQDYVDAVRGYLTDHMRTGDVVFVGQKLMDEEDRQSSLYVDFVKSFAKRIAAKGGSLVLLDGVAPPEKPPEYCIGRFGDLVAGCTIARADVVSGYERFDKLALQAEQELPNFYYVALRAGLCREDRCGQTMPSGAPIWHDKGHITEEASRELGPTLRAALEKQHFFERSPEPLPK